MDEADPDDVAASWLAAMRRGDFEAAWRQTDRIELPRRERQARGGFQWQRHHLVWDGAPFDGKTVLVRCEHGMGDTLQFIRFVPAIVERARRVIVRMQPQLLPLFDGAPQLGEVTNGWTDEPPPPHDVQIEVMELPYAFRCTADALPPPYRGFAERIAGRGVVLPRGEPVKVGLLWAASHWDRTRSVLLETLEPLLAIPCMRFFSLQQDDAPGVEQAQRLGVEALSHHTTDIADAAAAMLQLDLVITVDGMPAHLAGSLGRPTWVMLKHDADWRWMQHRSDTPWYPSVKLWRQPVPDDWRAVVTAMAAELRAWRR